jgi:hypothetical protein
MKKQLIIAAVAATMVGSASATIDFSGKYEGKLGVKSGITTYTQKVDLKLTGKHKDTTVITTFDIDTGKDFAVGESYIKTKIAGLSVKAGLRKGLHGNGLTYKKSSAAEKITIGTSFSGFGVSLTQKSNSPTVNLDVKGAVGPVKVKVQNITRDARVLSLSGSVAGFSLNLEDSELTTAYSLGGSMSGISGKYVSIGLKGANTATQNDGIFGDITGATDVDGLVVSTKLGFGKITGKHYKATFAATEKTTNKITLSAGGVSYSYANTDDATAGSSTDSFSAKIKFKF